MINVKVEVNFPDAVFVAIQRGIIGMVDQLSAIGQRVAIDKAPKDTSLLITSIHIIRDFLPPRFQGGIQTNLPYAIVMNDGRKPGGSFPPALPISRWIVRHKASFAAGLKRLEPKNPRGGVSRAQRALNSMTFLVSRKIAQKGIKGKKFFEKAEKAVEKAISPHLQALGVQIETAWEGG